MSKVSSLRKTLERAIGRSVRASDNTVIQFPGAPKLRRKKRVKKPKRYARITKWDDKFIGGSGKGKTAARDYFTKVEINGKAYMRRDDGALFALQRDGSWLLTKAPRAKAKGISMRKVLPYAAAAGAGAAGAGYLASRNKD